MSLGLRIVAVLKIIFGIIFLILVGGFTLLSLWASHERIPLSIKLYGTFASLFILVYVINGFSLFGLKSWARKISIGLDLGAICIDSFIFVLGVLRDLRYGEILVPFYGYHLVIIAIFAIFVYYLTRPEVKEQFK